MDTKELRQKSREELNVLLAEFRKALANARFHGTTERAKQVREIRRLRREVSRLLTVLHELTLSFPSSSSV